jgi:hypothetical protein
MTELAKSLEGLTGAYSALQETKIAEQAEQTDLYVSRIRAGFGSQATQDDINNVTSNLHPKVRQRVTEDYMYGLGTEFVSKAMETMPYEVTLSPEAETAYFDNIRKEALAAAGGDPLRAAGFMKAVEGQIAQRRQQTSASRVAEWQGIQKDAFGNSLMMEADAVAGASVLPELSAQISAVAAKYPEYPWLSAYLHRTAQIESTGGRDKYNKLGSGAAGPFQFMPGTAKQYGVVDPLDFAQATDGAARLAINGFNALKGVMGREPTPAEIYLYHQQGSGGGPALLRNPDASALEVLTQVYGKESTAKKAILDNGGNLDMTAGQFAMKWMSKFGNVSYDPSNPGLPAEALALREAFFGKDEEYKLTGSLANYERRDIAAQSFLSKALEYRDERFLLAMPDELMTPALRAEYAKAREQIGNLKMADLRDEEFQKDLAEKQMKRDIAVDVINRRAAGEKVDPITFAIDPATGRVDPVKLEAAQQALNTSSSLISPVQSKRNAYALQGQLRDAFLKGDFEGIPGLTFNGEQPTADEIRDYIIFRPDLNDAQKLELFNAVESELSSVAFLQNPTVDKWFNTNVAATLEGMLRDPVMSAKLMKFPNIRDTVREAFELSLLTSIQSNGGIPVDMRSMLDVAVKDARTVLDSAVAGTATISPVETEMGFPVGYVTTDSAGTKWRKVKDGADNDISNWEQIE